MAEQMFGVIENTSLKSIKTYPHPRPVEPVQLYLLVGLSGFGLIALWLAAFHAFLKVANPAQAFFAATLIEAGLIIEALALIKRPKVWYTWGAVAISLIVSGTYNYIQAAAVAGESLNNWMLFTLALGPLAALSFVSLTLGHELRDYQNRVDKWLTDRADWLEQRRLEVEAYERQQEVERQARQARLQQAEYERQEREAERRYEAERAEREWQHRQQELAQRRLERKERVAEPAQVSTSAGPAPAQPAERIQSQLTCGGCSRTFGTQAALNAHKRFCSGLKAGESQQLEPVVLAVNGRSRE